MIVLLFEINKTIICKNHLAVKDKFKHERQISGEIITERQFCLFLFSML